MPFNINEIKSVIEAGAGPALASKYEAKFFLPISLIADSAILQSNSLSILCNSIAFPGKSLATTQMRHYGHPVDVPYQNVFDKLSVQFTATNDMSQKKIFDEWMRSIVDPTTGYVEYYDNYIGDIMLTKLSDAESSTYTVFIEEVYPVTMPDIQVSGAAQNEVINVSITFSFRRWRSLRDRLVGTLAGATAGFQIPGLTNQAGESFGSGDAFNNVIVPGVPGSPVQTVGQAIRGQLGQQPRFVLEDIIR